MGIPPVFRKGFPLRDLVPKSQQQVFNPKYTSQSMYSKTVHFCTSIPNPNLKIKLMLNTSKDVAGFDAGFAVLDLQAKTGSKSTKVFDPLKLLIHCSSDHSPNQPKCVPKGATHIQNAQDTGNWMPHYHMSWQSRGIY